MANPEHVQVVRGGSAAIALWRSQHPRARLDLSGANLPQANLIGAFLIEANLIGANLIMANLIMANLSWADLTGANLFGANLPRADLTGANLSGADLTAADLSWANLTETNLTGARCGSTTFANCDLAQCLGLESVVHSDPSSIGIDTIIRSGGSIPEAFLLGAGVPKALLDALPAILAKVPYHSCFIAYGEPDRAFAERLVKDLRTKGVLTWIYSMDATPGEPTWREIIQKRREADKMVVLCSAPALVRDGVLKEVEEQIGEDPDKMVPVSLDNLWKADGFRVMRVVGQDLKPFLLDKNYADFSDASSYEKSLGRLLKALERKPG
ncbi:MAG: pentapeptide repeat protein [Dehalococcoidia bacterium]|nr:pentapeptide repeat protein [Dehalococcoidia bacterium]